MAFKILLYYGLRREEVCGLRWPSLRGDQLYIEHTVARVRTVTAKDRTKNHSSFRSYPIPNDILDGLESLRKKQAHNKIVFGSAYKDTDYIFTWEDGHPYSPDYLSRCFKKLVRSHEDLDNALTLHSLRRSCVSILAHEGVPIKDIQTWVGQSDIKTTMDIYAQTDERQKKATANVLTKVIFRDTEDDS